MTEIEFKAQLAAVTRERDSMLVPYTSEPCPNCIHGAVINGRRVHVPGCQSVSFASANQLLLGFAMLLVGCAPCEKDAPADMPENYGTTCNDAGSCIVKSPYPFPDCAGTDMRLCQQHTDGG